VAVQTSRENAIHGQRLVRVRHAGSDEAHPGGETAPAAATSSAGPAERADQANQASRAGRADSAGRTNRAGRADSAGQAGLTGRAGRGERIERAVPDRAGGVDLARRSRWPDCRWPSIGGRAHPALRTGRSWGRARNPAGPGDRTTKARHYGISSPGHRGPPRGAYGRRGQWGEFASLRRNGREAERRRLPNM
jgi:hypothetical protein